MAQATTWALTANDTTKTSPNILTLLVLQKIIDGRNSSLALYGNAKLEKPKGQMKEAFILLPDSPYSLLLNVSQLSLPFTVGGDNRIHLGIICQSGLTIQIKSKYSSNQRKAIHIKFQWYCTVLRILVDQKLS